ncbi:transposase [Parafrankia sp. FMc6]|uniref:transposase n=1 Tax=Parafrankia soli TaxID=2599596 RepID=UPI0034D52FED
METPRKRRAATVETGIGHLKDLTGLRCFRRRGTPAVTAGLGLACTALNLFRLHPALTPTWQQPTPQRHPPAPSSAKPILRWAHRSGR